MSSRLSKGGELSNRGEIVEFHSMDDGFLVFRRYIGIIVANDQNLVGRSFKYHRPRGIISSGVEEPNALVSLERGSKFEPNPGHGN